MTPRLPQEVRDLIALTQAGWGAVDGVVGRFWQDVERILRPYGDRPLTRADRRIIMRSLDRVISRVFGLTQRAAMVSELFTTIVRVSSAASERPFVRLLERTRNLIERREPGLWQRIRQRAAIRPNDPLLRTVAAFDGPVVERQRLLRARGLDPQRKWVNGDNYRLSDRVWKQGRETRRAIDARIVQGIRNGEDALDIARDLERHLNPRMQPTTIRQDGKVVRRNQTRYPGRGGWGSAPARTLVRTEIQRAYNQATIEAGKVTPGATGCKWNLSNRHVLVDRCDVHARNHSPGMGRGEYTFEEFPPMPDHPNCLCFSTIATVSRDAMVDDLIKRYGYAP